jgi:hypothetical protein
MLPLLNQPQFLEWIDHLALCWKHYLLLLKHLVCLHELALLLPLGLRGHHLGPSLDAVQEEDEEGGGTLPVFLAPHEYQLALEHHVALLTLFFVVLSEDGKALHNLLFDVAIEIGVVFVEALVQ